MRLLLDESVPATLRRHIAGHEVRTVVEMGWSGVMNGKLLALAAAEFDAFVTVDKNMPFQQNLETLPIALVVLDAVSNEVQALVPLLPALQRALASLQAKSCVIVQAETQGGAPKP
jgi:predicted nuclease of predicted toxin-antitoxin system